MCSSAYPLTLPVAWRSSCHIVGSQRHLINMSWPPAYHDRAKRLKLEWMREAAQKFVAAVVMNDSLGEGACQGSHTLREPFGHLAGVQWQIGATATLRHEC
jgi:hypothetical protein